MCMKFTIVCRNQFIFVCITPWLQIEPLVKKKKDRILKLVSR